MTRTLRGKVAVAGVGETTYFKHGQSPHSEFMLALQAILAACEDAGIDPRRIDGFASYSNDRNDPSRLAAALGLPALRFSNMNWGGGGGGGSAAVGNGAAAVACGIANCVVVFRALAQGQFQRFGAAPPGGTASGEAALNAPYGVMSPAQRYAMRAMRFLHENKIADSAQRAIALASYQHAQSNPRAVMHGRPLTAEAYDASRWIVEPWRLFDCCQENDGAAALIIVPAEHAKDFRQTPAYLLGSTQGSEYRNGARSHNAPLYATSSFTTVAPQLYEMAGVKPKDVDVVQSYENFTGGVLMSLVEHGFFTAEEANGFLTKENLLAPSGKLPLNTSGGNLAECYMHGLELQVEAVRQLRGQSTAQVPGAEISMVISGPMVTPVSSMILGTEATL
ncbi:MAG: acetyl-CoA acetyltransferase [Alphaproteobacteria bacterium RIFCSPHIGHO2_12_FULL_66_14]|jgi:acetyl-CoA acetyltransferase|nr:MAG: acetyl-CoA acetyltransferase [Alphaproteobacteria bacterium RIFCSPHIGHO2_12_FULL_66_14]